MSEPVKCWFPVWLARRVSHKDEPRGCDSRRGLYVAAMKLPLPPVAGLGVIVDNGFDPEPIKQVFVNEVGAIICRLPDEQWAKVDMPYAEWLGVHEFLMAGWRFLGDCGPSLTQLYNLTPPGPMALHQFRRARGRRHRRP